jgi:hypothetical protein
MPITPNVPAAITRYYAVGVTEVLFCATIANTAAPTFAELDAGTDISDEVADWSGWSVSTNFIDTPTLGTRFTAQLPGRISAESSSITVYADRLSVDLRDLMPRDTTGYIVIADGGLASGVGDVFKVQVASVTKLRSLDAAGQLRFDYAILAEPAEDVTLPQS